MSIGTDPSPWAPPSSPWDDDTLPTTAEMLEEAERLRLEAITTEQADAELWKRYAGRLAADGSLIR